MGESPRWHDGRLWVADWMAQEVLVVDPASGAREVAAKIPSLPISIDWLPAPDGRLLAVAGSDKRLLRQEADGSLVTHADLSAVCDYAWNEIVVDGRGNVYVNSIGYDMMAGEAPRDGVVAVVTPDGAVRQVADGVSFPNGMAVTPDNSTLLVAESHAQRITAFDIAADGSLANRRVWADLGDDPPDGICIDAEGAVWYADVPHRQCVRVREGGEVLQTVEVDRACFACMLGGSPDAPELYIVATVWDDAVSFVDPNHTGVVLAVDAPAPAAGYP
jgi:sugar lactone lactonase YvrE